MRMCNSCVSVVNISFTCLSNDCFYWQIQVAWLSQRDRAAGLVSYGQKWKTGTGRQYFTDAIGLSLTTVTHLASKAIKFGKKTQNKGYYAVQSHSKSFNVIKVSINRNPLCDFLLVINTN